MDINMLKPQEKAYFRKKLQIFLLKLYISKRFTHFRQNTAQYTNRYVEDNFLKSAFSRTRFRKHVASSLFKFKTLSVKPILAFF